MKYIRTKDGELHFNLGETKNGVIIEYNYLGDGLDLAVNYDAIERQADTIEELCDEYVAVGIPFRTFIVDLDELKKSGLDIHSFSRACYMQYKNCAIYGAVYTDKGLIYVAKMNDKGELELL